MPPLDAAAVERASKAVLGKMAAAAMEITGRQLDEMILAELGAGCTLEALEVHREVVHEAFLSHIQQYLPALDDTPSAGEASQTAKKAAKGADAPKKRAMKQESKPTADVASSAAKPAKAAAKASSVKSGDSRNSRAKADAKESEDESSDESSDDAPRKQGKATKQSSKDPLARLKKYVAACGVRRSWKRELEGMSQRQARTHIEAVLVELGIEGRPTLEKCKAVRKRRDFESEIRELDPSNVLGVRLRSQRGAESDAQDSDAEPASPPHARFNLLAYGDPDE